MAYVNFCLYSVALQIPPFIIYHTLVKVTLSYLLKFSYTCMNVPEDVSIYLCVYNVYLQRSEIVTGLLCTTALQLRSTSRISTLLILRKIFFKLHTRSESLKLFLCWHKSRNFIGGTKVAKHGHRS